ncbi:hypothetical protein ABK040_008129 [Willaertia magna]
MKQAMETLSSMFPDYPQETLKSVLYETNGHMERTIECLLQMGPPPSSTNNYQTSSNNNNNRSASSTTTKGPSVRHNLPADFLRYSDLCPQDEGNRSSSNMEEDERLAYQLQTGLYLQSNHDNSPSYPSGPLTSQTTFNNQQPYNMYSTPPPTSNPIPMRTTSTSSRMVGIEGHGTGSSSSRTTSGSTNNNPSGIDQLSDFAKKKFGEFKKMFGNKNTKTTNQEEDETVMRSGLLRDSDDEEENNRL